MDSDKLLLEIYMNGFNDELYGRDTVLVEKTLRQRAYDLGRIDALVGDDISSSDLQTNEDILRMIRK